MNRQKRLYHKRLDTGLCPKCGKARDVENQIHCHHCIERMRVAYHKNSSSYKKSMRDRNLELKLECFNHYGSVCQCCGEPEIAFLTLDHINGDGSKHRKLIGTGGTRLFWWIKKNGFPKGFQTLCRNCNWAKYRLGKCPHKNPPSA
jgi:hypothetical protein